ncbi:MULTISPECIES: hypothetical protein [Pseudomonas]|uniref:Uncharacterized protein n=1 Tax=Pseudomonas lactis TaxID=1615674 RepID=A0ABS9FMB5_9PSED|nr:MULTISPECIES: hypothetical protein [Pseudomonas]MCF4971574.1 hypothetical protein [Pseudomonas lactis]MCF5000697.1 hypothetical protein [Pseudomonas lactis]MCF5006811.1 hypothetical protein [Pseudomonas lactis]MCF5011494.1 hypothetical protein [Pseudomonas lactis]MCF5016560.1 hypothetical protein [Pseudomonas lactis]
MNDELLKLMIDAIQKFTDELKAVQTTNKQIQNSLATILTNTLKVNAKPKDDEFTGYSLNTADQDITHG